MQVPNPFRVMCGVQHPVVFLAGVAAMGYLKDKEKLNGSGRVRRTQGSYVRCTETDLLKKVG